MSLLKRKKILFITPTFFPHTFFGGSIFSSYKMCIDLTKEYEVTVLTTNQQNKDLSPYQNIERKYKDIKVNFCAEELTGLFSISFFKYIFQNKKKYDLFYINDFFSLYGLISIMLGSFFKKKTILAPRGSFSTYTINRSKTVFKNLFIKLLIIISKNNSLLDFHATSNLEKLEILNLKFNNKVHVIPNLFDIDKYLKIQNYFKNRNIPKNKIVISYFGRVDPKKYFKLFINLSKYFNKQNYDEDYEFRIAGANTFYSSNELRDILSKSNCKFFGELNQKKKFKFIYDSDMLFFLSENENFGNSAFEFLIFNKPILVLNNNLWSNYDDNNILVAKSKNLEYLTQLIIDFFSKNKSYKTSSYLLNLFKSENRIVDYKKFSE